MKVKNVFDAYPMLETPEGNLCDTIAICKYLA